MLEDVIRDKLKVEERISVYTYMQMCLMHPEFGYYMQDKDVLGRLGDFTTAPEVSPFFAEMLAIWVFQEWEKLQKPKKLVLVELGGGTGRLMQGIVTTLKGVSGFTCDVAVCFYDISPFFRRQQAAIKGAASVQTYDSLDFLDALDVPICVLANEFFDALPVRQYAQQAGEYVEVGVTLGKQFNLEYASLPIRYTPESLEEAPDMPGILTALIRALKRVGGAAAIIDYGYTEGAGHTLQAIYQHRSVDVFDHPGKADLSAHVNYKKIGLHCKQEGLHYAYCTQREFLINLGIALRLQQACMHTDDVKRRQALISGVDRLINPAEMGHLFKVLTTWMH